MPHLTTNLITILVEVVAVIVLFLILGAISRRVLRLVSAQSKDSMQAGLATLEKTIGRFITFIGVLACLAVVGVNGYFAWEGEHLPDFTLAKLKEVPDDFWIQMGIGAGKVLGLIIVAAIVLRILRRILARLAGVAKSYEGIKANNESIDSLFGALTRVLSRATWLGVLALAAVLLNTPDSVQGGAMLILQIYLTVAIGLIVLRAVAAITESLDALSNKYARSKDLLAYYDKLKPLMPALTRSIEWIVYVFIATLVLELIDSEALAVWGPRLVKVIGIMFLGRVFIALVNLLLEEFLIRRPKLEPDQMQRRKTLVPLFRSVINYVIYFTMAILILEEIQFDVTPFLAGAGILALAVGLGAQNLINDMVSGLFILFENHFLVGDVIKVNGAVGTVEAIELRTVRMRDLRGRVHIVRNGQINELINFSKEYTCAMIDVGVAYDSDLKAVFAALDAVGDRVQKENDDVLAKTEVLGIQEFDDSEMTIRILTKVKPGCNATVERHLRKLIKEAFDARGIQIPFPHRVVLQKEMPAA